MREAWPSLPFQEWKDTYATLHMWTQIVGKIRLAQTPWVNHSWHATLYVTSRGLTTSPIPYGALTFQIDFDFMDHQLLIQTSDGRVETMPLAPRSVADFHEELFARLAELGLRVEIYKHPNEVMDPIAFDRDEAHASYDAGYAHRFWLALAQADRVLKKFRARTARIAPGGAAYNPELGEYLLPYEEVRRSAAPEETLLEFLQSTYEAAADFGAWNRSELERAELP